MPPLDEYQRKRDFQRTPEPRVEERASESKPLFVVQKHRATRLHYDFRIEMDGVLWSWAVPKGPSLDPREKRLAIRTEDHPIEYADFEGVIPEGEYGGGSMMVWDRGTWSPIVPVAEALKKGNLKIALHGHKLVGAWALVKMKTKDSDKHWLLIKERDDETLSEDVYSVTSAEPFSALNGRELTEIAAESNDKRGAHDARVFRRGLYATKNLNVGSLSNAVRMKRAVRLPKVKPKPVTTVQEGSDWLHEILHEGERIRIQLHESIVGITSSDGTAITNKVPVIAQQLAQLPVESAVLDGLITVLDTTGVGSRELMSAELARRRAVEPLCIVFDVPACAGFDLRKSPLIKRKELLKRILGERNGYVRYCDHVAGEGSKIADHARALGALGLVSKPADSPYPSPRNNAWCALRFERENSDRPRRAASQQLDESCTVAGVTITHPRRILYPEQRVTKQMLAEYYEAIAERMLPHVAGRPLSIYRGPQGVEGDCFFQKNLGDMPGDHVTAVSANDPKADSYITIKDVRGLVTLAQWSALELHAWGCKADRIEKPDRVVFDLDPGPGASWALVIEGAKGLHFVLSELGLESWVKTSGGKGLHVVVPIARRHSWDDVKELSAGIARMVERAAPKHFTTLMSKDIRVGRVFIDYLRNMRGATCVAAYSTRARPGCTASVPIAWEELGDITRQLTMVEAIERAASHDDPWSALNHPKQTISRSAQESVRNAAK